MLSIWIWFAIWRNFCEQFPIVHYYPIYLCFCLKFFLCWFFSLPRHVNAHLLQCFSKIIFTRWTQDVSVLQTTCIIILKIISVNNFSILLFTILCQHAVNSLTTCTQFNRTITGSSRIQWRKSLTQCYSKGVALSTVLLCGRLPRLSVVIAELLQLNTPLRLQWYKKGKRLALRVL